MTAPNRAEVDLALFVFLAGGDSPATRITKRRPKLDIVRGQSVERQSPGSPGRA